METSEKKTMSIEENLIDMCENNEITNGELHNCLSQLFRGSKKLVIRQSTDETGKTIKVVINID